MNIVLATHILISIALLVVTGLRTAPANRRRARWLQRLQFGAAAGSFGSGVALVAVGASVTHLCVSGALLLAIVAAVELYARGSQRPLFEQDNTKR